VSARGRAAILLSVPVLALGASGCIGDGEEDDATQPTTERPDSPGNDLPPAPGSPEEQFERFCEQNPGACG
jgi:hypothetical protein